jgi:hypothetical protein
MHTQRPRLAWALLGLTVVLVAASVAIGLARGERWNAVFGFIPVALAFTIVGALVAARTGRSPSFWRSAGRCTSSPRCCTPMAGFRRRAGARGVDSGHRRRRRDGDVSDLGCQLLE